MMFLRRAASSFSAFLAVSASPLVSASDRCQAAYMAASKSLVWFAMRRVRIERERERKQKERKKERKLKLYEPPLGHQTTLYETPPQAAKLLRIPMSNL